MKKTITNQVLELLVVTQTYRQIKDSLGIESENTLYHALNNLRAAGCIERMIVDNPLKGERSRAKRTTFAYKATGVPYGPKFGVPANSSQPSPEIEDRESLIRRINTLENEARRLRVKLTLMDAGGDS